MLGSLQANVARLLGHSPDPLGLISPEQLKTVLRSIESKYNALRDENARLKGTLADLRMAQEQLESELERAKDEAQRVENDELARLRSEFAVVKQATEVLSSELARSETDTEKMRKESSRAEAVADTLRAELTKAQGATDSWRHEMLEIQTTKDAMHAALELRKQQIEQQEMELQACYQELLALRNQELDTADLDALQAQLEAAQQYKVEMIAALEEEAVAKRALKADAEHWEACFKEAVKAQQELELDRVRLNAQLLTAKADIKSQERLAVVEEEKTLLSRQVDTLQAECDRLKSELQRSQAAAYRPATAEPAKSEGTVSPEERRRLLAQLISGKST